MMGVINFYANRNPWHHSGMSNLEDRALLRELLRPSENHTYKPGRDMHGSCGSGRVGYENAKVEC
jgi:hypothetical protein